MVRVLNVWRWAVVGVVPLQISIKLEYFPKLESSRTFFHRVLP